MRTVSVRRRDGRALRRWRPPRGRGGLLTEGVEEVAGWSSPLVGLKKIVRFDGLLDGAWHVRQDVSEVRHARVSGAVERTAWTSRAMRMPTALTGPGTAAPRQMILPKRV